MGIKRCPSFSKRPGFPCGLRVLLVDSHAAQRSESEQLLKECSYEVTPCSSVPEALTKLSGMCSFDVLLADKPTLSSSSGAAVQQLLAAADGLPCILMAAAPNADDVMAGVELGAVDFLAKPLALPKLRNIWQHTVRKMMCNMDISCDDPSDGLLPPGPSGKERVSMEVIMEEADEEAAAAAAGGCASRGASFSVEAAAAGATPRSSTSNAPGGSVINYSNAPNMALAIASSFYGPSGATSLSRSSSGAAAAPQASDDSRCGSPGSPDSRPAKQQHCSHGAVRSCPSTRSLNSAGSCQSTWQLPGSPSSMSLAKLASDASAAAAAEQAAEDEAKAAQMQQRCPKKAVRHPPAAAAASPVSASKPPLCSKPVAGVPAARMQQQPTAAATGAPVAAVAGVPGTSSGGMPAVLASVPLPTGLGPLPQGMVWGMPMCPLVRAPGIVPPAAPAAGSMALGGQVAAAMPGWGMCGMPAMFGAMPPNPFMSAYSALPMPGMAFSSAASCMMGAAAMQSCYAMHDPAMQAAGYGFAQQHQHQQLSHAAAGPARAASAPTGAAAAAALGAIDLLGSGAVSGGAARSAGGLPPTAEDEEAAALDFVLGDIAAEDDITDVCGSLLDADMSNLDQGGLHLPAQLPTAMQALEAELQQQTAAARASFDCSSMQHGGRVSFDCSAASTCTAAGRASFETSNRSCSNRVSFEVSTMSRCHSSRVSFEVQGMQAGGAAAAGAAAGACAVTAAAAKMAPAASAPPTLLGSVSDLFAAACSDDSSHGSGLHHVDSCSMLADLQSLFAASGDSSCPADCADSAVADSEELFVDALGDGLDGLPLGLAMRKSSSLAQLINAGLPTAMAT